MNARTNAPIIRQAMGYFILLLSSFFPSQASACPPCYYEECIFRACVCLPSSGCLVPRSKANYCGKCKTWTAWRNFSEYGDIAFNTKMAIWCKGEFSGHPGRCTARELGGFSPRSATMYETYSGYALENGGHYLIMHDDNLDD